MPVIPHISTKIGNSYFIWFQNSNSFVLLEEPARYVFSRIKKRNKPDTIARLFATRYDVPAEQSRPFVLDICAEIAKLNQSDQIQSKNEQVQDTLAGYEFEPYSVHFYRLGDKIIAFSFETQILEYYLHPLISHLEIHHKVADATRFELFTTGNQTIFRFRGEVMGIWTNEESHLVKGKIFTVLINELYDKKEDDWLMTVHASAVTNHKKTILFCAPPGHGKTTIAALLSSRGFELVSEDFVPVDRSTFSAYPFPTAMSVKEGSMEVLTPHFPTLEQKSLNYISPEKSVRYLTADHDHDITGKPFPVREFVFIEYRSSADFYIETLDTGTAIKLLLDQSWIIPAKNNAKRLFEFVGQTAFLKLIYSDNEKALDFLTDLFSHE